MISTSTPIISVTTWNKTFFVIYQNSACSLVIIFSHFSKQRLFSSDHFYSFLKTAPALWWSFFLISQNSARSCIEKMAPKNVPWRCNVVHPFLPLDSFNYSKPARNKALMKNEINKRYPAIGAKFHRLGLKPKIGSLQQFVKNYKVII